MGDGLPSGIDERKISKHSIVKVRCFLGSTLSDLLWHYRQTLTSKALSMAIIHIANNDAGSKEPLRIKP